MLMFPSFIHQLFYPGVRNNPNLARATESDISVREMSFHSHVPNP